MFKGAIFDLDGTLIDSIGIWEEIDRRYLAAKGFEATPEMSRMMFGMTMDLSCAYMKELFGIEDSIATMRHDILRLVQDFYLYEVKLKPGALALIQELHRRHIPMAIATSNTKELVLATLESHGILDYFTYVMTSDEVGSSKESPEIYHRASYYLHSHPEDTYVFEDALHAITTAHDAHFHVVGVYDAYSESDEEAIRAIADEYVYNLTDVLKGAQYDKKAL